MHLQTTSWVKVEKKIVEESKNTIEYCSWRNYANYQLSWVSGIESAPSLGQLNHCNDDKEQMWHYYKVKTKTNKVKRFWINVETDIISSALFQARHSHSACSSLGKSPQRWK